MLTEKSDNERLDALKASLRIPYTDDDELLTHLDEAAQAYVTNAVNSEGGFDDDELYYNASILLTQYWYLNRGEAVSDYVPVYILSMIQQLRGKYA